MGVRPAMEGKHVHAGPQANFTFLDDISVAQSVDSSRFNATQERLGMLSPGGLDEETGGESGDEDDDARQSAHGGLLSRLPVGKPDSN